MDKEKLQEFKKKVKEIYEKAQEIYEKENMPTNNKEEE